MGQNSSRHTGISNRVAVNAHISFGQIFITTCRYLYMALSKQAKKTEYPSDVTQHALTGLGSDGENIRRDDIVAVYLRSSLSMLNT